MSGSSIDALDLAALLCSRVCHDLISPVGAIVNGLEVLAEGKDEATKTFALDLIKKSGIRPDVLLIDYHLDEGNGVDAIVRLRQDFGADLPAILITADRSPKVREDAGTIDVAVLNKPVKPAALRAFLAQWRVTRPAAE